MSNCQCDGAGWMKFYIGRDKPGLPANLEADKDGIRWLGNSGEGYALVRCPGCNSKLGPTKDEQKRASAREAA